MLEPALLSSEVQMDSLQRRTTATHQVVKARGGLSSTDGGRTGSVSYKRSVQTSVDGKNNVIKPYKWWVEISGGMLNLLVMTQTQPWWRNDSAHKFPGVMNGCWLFEDSDSKLGIGRNTTW